MQNKVADEILVSRVLNGDSAAFRALVMRYQNMVFTIVLRIVGGREEAEETAQDVFMKVYSNLDGFKGAAKFSSWLYRIAYNTALTRTRNKKPAHVNIDSREGSVGVAVLNTSDQTFDREYLNTAMSLLELEDATIITLFYFFEQSIDEIATILEVEPNTAKVRLFRARKRLREKVELIG